VVSFPSGQPAVGAEVRLKNDFDREAHTYPDTDSPEAWHKHMREFWDQCPWFSDVTDKDGQAAVCIKYTALDRSWCSKPPASRDWVSGRPFLVKVKQGSMPEEELSVLMKPGESLTGKVFAVTVLEVQQPKYVPTQ
jgi:hypothetical protein